MKIGPCPQCPDCRHDELNGCNANRSAAALRNRSIPHGFGFAVSLGDSGRRERFRSRGRLKALEAERIVDRRQFLDGAVVAAEYSYTDYGRTLIPALDALGNWGVIHNDRNRVQ